MRQATRAMGWVLAGLLPCAACLQRPTYACADAAQCVVGDVQGFCEQNGLCSYVDGDCASGRRYGPYSGSRAEACVEGAGTSSAGAETSSSDTGSDDGTSASSGSETALDTGCVGECPAAGERLRFVRAPELGVGRAHAVAIAGGGGVAITGEIADGIAVAVFDPGDGALVSSSSWPAATTGPDRGHAIAALGDDLVIAGIETSDAGLHRGVLARVDGDLAVVWSQRWDTLGDDGLRGVAVDATGRIVAAGSSGARALVVTYDEDGVLLGTRLFDPPPPASGASLRAVTPAAGGGAWVAGSLARSSGSELWVRRLGEGGGVVHELRPDNPGMTDDVALAVASPSTGEALVGGVIAGDAWLAQIDTAGALAFSRAVQAGGTVHAIAVAPDGTIVAAGHADAGARGRDVWIAAFAPDGGPLWVQTHDEAGLDDAALGLALGDGVAWVAGYSTDTGGEAMWLGAYAL